MKKLILPLMILVMILCTGPAFADDDFDVQKSDIPMGQVIEDFTLTTLDGATFHLEDVLKEKKAVLINFFKVSCPFCVREFPILSEMAQKYADQAAFIAVDSNQYDTPDDIRQLIEEAGISFQVAQDVFPSAFKIPYEGYPCTVVLDKNGELAYYRDYGFEDSEDLESVFGAILAPDYEKGFQLLQFCDDLYAAMDDEEEEDEYQDGYILVVMDQNDDPVPGVFVNFCSETQMTCRMDQTDEDGAVYFEVPEDRYHIEFLSVPEGYSFEQGFEAYTEEHYGDPIVLQITKN